MSIPKELSLSREEDKKAFRYYRALAEAVAKKYGDDPVLLKASLKGLAKAFRLFDAESKFKFSTYAAYFMKTECEKKQKRDSKIK